MQNYQLRQDPSLLHSASSVTMSVRHPFGQRADVIDLTRIDEERNTKFNRNVDGVRLPPRMPVVHKQRTVLSNNITGGDNKDVVTISDDDEDVSLQRPTSFSQKMSSSADRGPQRELSKLTQPNVNKSPGRGQKRTYAEAHEMRPAFPASRYPTIPQILNHRYQERRLEIRSKRRCFECIDNGLECDGERPCSRCVEPGFDCIYEGDAEIATSPKAHLRKDGIRNIKPVEEIPMLLHRTPGHVERTKREPYSMAKTNEPVASKTKVDLAEPQNTKPISRIPWQPKDDKEMTDMVERYQREWQRQRESWLQAQLVYAKRKDQLTPNNPSPKMRANPFRKLLADNAANNDNEGAFLKVQIKTKKETFKTMLVPYETLEVDYTLPILPRYRSIGRMGPNFLSRNVHTLTYMPYFAEEEMINDTQLAQDRETEMKQRYRNTSSDVSYDQGLFDDLVKQRKCLERVHRLSCMFDTLISRLGITKVHLGTWLQQNMPDKCKVCSLTFNQPRDLSSVTALTEAENRACLWISNAIFKVTNVPLWHFVERRYTDHVAKRELKPDDQQGFDAQESLCSICFIPNCLTHGSYVDGTDEDNESGVFINDPEIENNTRQRAVIGMRSNSADHVCGVFCLAEYLTPGVRHRLCEVIGIDESGQLTGLRNEKPTLSTQLTVFKDLKACEKDCFIFRHRRRGHWDLVPQSMPDLEKWQGKILRSSIKLYGNNLRLPCFLAKRMRIGCVDAFKHVLVLHQRGVHSDKSPSPEPEKTRKLSKIAAGYKTHSSNDLDHRKPILPCSHTGPCLASEDCSCASENVFCEVFCNCDKSCRRRFTGCRCKGKCFNDPRCECWTQNRECDPWVCGSCGVLEVLDPSNKYNEEIRQGRCRNTFAQLDLPARTIKAPSEVQGWGLYAGQDMERNTYIGEYKGEVISGKEMQESDRRGVVYHNLGQEYLFIINSEQELDGSVFGNKTRFMNNSQRDENINIWAHRLISNGVVRVLFFTKRSVKAGEELLYNYNYDPKVTKFFWEKDEVVRKDGLMPIAKPKISGVDPRAARNTGVAKVTEEETPPREREHAIMRKQLKKRGNVGALHDDDDDDDDDDYEDNDRDEGLAFRGSGRGTTQRYIRLTKPPTESSSSFDDDEDDNIPPGAGDDNEGYADDQDEDEGSQGDSEGAAEESDEDDVFNATSTKRGKPRQRRTFPGDRRYGGEAQRRAAKTRAERKKLGGKY